MSTIESQIFVLVDLDMHLYMNHQHCAQSCNSACIIKIHLGMSTSSNMNMGLCVYTVVHRLGDTISIHFIVVLKPLTKGTSHNFRETGLVNHSANA